MADSRITIQKLKPEDIGAVAKRIRAIDREEIYLASLLDPERAIKVSVANAEYAYTVRYDDEVALVFGINRRSLLCDVFAPWMLGTDIVDSHPILFTRDSLVFIKRLVANYPMQENWVLEKNVAAVAWLKWLGFDMDPPAPHGACRANFIRFHKGMNDVL